MRIKFNSNMVKREILKHVWAVRIFLIFLVLVFLVSFIILSARFISGTKLGEYLTLGKYFLLPTQSEIAKNRDKINILVLGKGGEGHEAPDLTDTIMFASVSLDEPQITIISLPRDIWITSLRTKLNSTYHYGGFLLTKSSVEEIAGQPIHYTVLLDFAGFEKMIDAIDGIDVDVERDFTDTKYPIAGREADLCNGDPQYKCRYETLEFKKGLNHMDGKLALKFVRSRNAQGDEGTDLARSARQQKVIQAIMAKILQPATLANKGRLENIFKVVSETVKTDIPQEGLPVLARKFIDARKNLRTSVLPEELLINPPISARYDRQYVFTPKAGNWTEVQKWVDGILE